MDRDQLPKQPVDDDQPERPPHNDGGFWAPRGVASRQERTMNPVEIAALDAFELLVVVDNESECSVDFAV